MFSCTGHGNLSRIVSMEIPYVDHYMYILNKITKLSTQFMHKQHKKLKMELS